MNRRLVLPDRPNARRGEKLRVNGVLEIAEQRAQALLSYQFLHTAEMNPYHSCVGVYARHHARNRILRFRALRAPATKESITYGNPVLPTDSQYLPKTSSGQAAARSEIQATTVPGCRAARLRRRRQGIRPCSHYSAQAIPSPRLSRDQGSSLPVSAGQPLRHLLSVPRRDGA